MCIPREHMPQVDFNRLPGLGEYLLAAKVPLVLRERAVIDLKAIQCLQSYNPYHSRTGEAAEKPVLVSRDGTIIDGNYRWMWHREMKHATLPCLEVQEDLYRTMTLIRAYSGTYTYGDGQHHPFSV